MSTMIDTSLEDALTAIAQQLDLPEGMFEQVKERYGSMSKWLEREGSVVAEFEPRIYAQGSFALGTVVRPLSDRDEFDIDLVCELQRRRTEVSQRTVKTDVGTEAKGYVVGNNFKKEIKEWEKCWTLEYSDKGYTFFMDVVPAVPDKMSQQRLLNEAKLDPRFADSAIGITDTDHPRYSVLCDDWIRGNPKGYAEWFKSRMQVRLYEMKAAYASKHLVKEAAEEVPDYKVKTPLQQAVQILKRHRDSYFENQNDKRYKTSSIILTTLAAHVYENQSSLVETLDGIIGRLEVPIRRSFDGLRVENPVDPEENFAEAWQEDRNYAEAFWAWLRQLRDDWASFKSEDSDGLSLILESNFGEGLTKRAFASLADSSTSLVELTEAKSTQLSLFNVAHREQPEKRWAVVAKSGVALSAKYSRTGNWIQLSNNAAPLPKHCDLEFHARTAIPAPYTVYWQVVNTGEEASNGGGLRGEIYKSKSYGVGGLTQRESTLYEGTHWIQCYIVKQGKCVAQSAPFVVNIGG